ncbi:MAG: DUF192 domain-containing protein [Patescibacteria group bacterium]|nr:DUF192 domain-containing protein [Patescibacteria group bacterium]MDE1944620.1 DUF192 domain-containing protein [Patescibacteria group bacterium]MDE1945262.1 DUF192 domain-containing protein [Patescibacteria group bacterium]MDE2058034.1 DUF192 domain-containing protein [Patescibacteria group bacterium]
MDERRLIGLSVVTALVMLGGIWLYRTSPHAQGAVEFGGVSLRLDYATTEPERELGLGGRADVPEGYGMLFVFPQDGSYGFWMKGTQVPLDIFWLDDEGRVVSVAADVATSTFPNVFYPAAPARYVLETAAGFARAHAVATGTPLDFARGALPTAQ